MLKNTHSVVDITDLGAEGAGVGRYEDGRVIFVRRSAVGDRVDAHIIKETSGYLVARIDKLLVSSPDRIECDCLYFDKGCGGCTFRHISYEAEQKAKLASVRSALRAVDDSILPKSIHTAQPVAYRNKAAYPVDAELHFGYYAQRSHRVVAHDRCLLEPEIFSQIASAFCELCKEYGISGYDEKSGRGVLRHIFMRSNREGDILLMPVVNAAELPCGKELAQAMTERFGCIKGICVNVNQKNTNVITGERTYMLFGDEYITETLLGKRFNVSAGSFFQVNPYACELLYSIVRDMASGAKILLDLYCGIGTIGLCAADDSAKLCGVEVVSRAVADAKVNMLLCGRSDDDTLFVCGDASVGVSECTRKFGAPDTVIVDPPRKGLSADVVDDIAKAAPNRLIYVSCNPFTLGRDLEMLKQSGYAPTRIECVDMFPRTNHVETVVSLSRKP